MLRNGEPIQTYRLNQGVKTGIFQTALIEGLVPEIEEREAAIFCGYTWKEWLEFDLSDPIDRWNRVSGIAHYRIHKIIQSNMDDAVNEHVDRQSRARRANG